MEGTNVWFWYICESGEAGVVLLEIAAISVTNGLLLQAVNVEIAINFDENLGVTMSHFDGLVHETVEF